MNSAKRVANSEQQRNDSSDSQQERRLHPSLSIRSGSEVVDNESPATIRSNHLADRRSGWAVRVEFPMLNHNFRFPGAFRCKCHLNFCKKVRIEFPLGCQLPREYQTRWRLPHQHLSNVAFATVFRNSVPATIQFRFKHFCLQRRLTDVMLPRPPPINAIRKYLERMLGGCVDGNFLHYRRNAGHSSDSISAAALNAARFRSQKRSR